MNWRYRVVERILDQESWRLRICKWKECSRIFIKWGRSEYHSAACARAAERENARQHRAASSPAPAKAVAPGYSLPRLTRRWGMLIDADLITRYLAECPDKRELDDHELGEHRHVITDPSGTRVCVSRGLVHYGRIESIFPASASLRCPARGEFLAREK
jgi:hypothetical protein